MTASRMRVLSKGALALEISDAVVVFGISLPDGSVLVTAAIYLANLEVTGSLRFTMRLQVQPSFRLPLMLPERSTLVRA